MQLMPVSINKVYTNTNFKSNSDKKELFLSNLKKIENQMDEYDKQSKYINDYIKSGSDKLSKQLELQKMHEVIQEAFNTLNKFWETKDILSPDASEKITEFLKAQKALGSNKGFNKIIGHDEVKKRLNQEFSINTILRSEVSKNIKVPNALLFYGPSGCGKSYFAEALAEQSICNYDLIECSNLMDENDLLKKLYKQFNISKDNYDKTGMRTIILLNEAEFKLYNGSRIENKFKELLKDCSDKYKCTLFLTSNNPLDLPDTILDKNTTPIKIPLPPPTINDIVTFLKMRISGLNGIDSKNIANSLPQTEYSYSSLNKIIESLISANKKSKISLEELLKSIKFAQVDKYSLECFEKAKKVLR